MLDERTPLGYPAGSLDDTSLADLPVGTTITCDAGYFEKNEAFWSSLDNHCGECETHIFFDDPDRKEDPNGYPRTLNNPEEHIKNWRVTSVPYQSLKVKS